MPSLQSISGNVTANNGNALPGVIVSAQCNGFPTRTTVTAENGHYSFRDIPPGDYLLEASMTGFQTTKAPNVLVGLDANVHVDFVMHPAGVSKD